MTKTPPVPEEFDSEEDLKAYIDQLHDQIEFLEEELTESEKEKLELKQELNEIENQASQIQAGGKGFASIMGPLESMRQRLEEFEEGYLDDDSDYGLSDDSEGTEALSEALGADITQDPENFKEELEDS
jgi:phage shock protein A